MHRLSLPAVAALLIELLLSRGLAAQEKKVVLRVEGKLTDKDPDDRLRKGCHHKAYEIKLVEGATYQIDLLGDLSPANDALKEAIATLQARKAKIKQKEAIQKVDVAIAMLAKLRLQSVVDTYLRLENAAGKNVEEDDDGGEGLNARITFTAPKTETYKIIASTFNEGDTGSFTLIVTQMSVAKQSGDKDKTKDSR